MEKYLGSEFKKLGFGFMRLPQINEDIDMDQVKKMVDTFMEKGFTYFDTAYVYHSEKSEGYLKEALVDRYDRSKFQVASKLPMFSVNSADQMEPFFETSRQRAGVEYFDFYLLHALGKETAQRCDDFGAWDLVKRLKAEGKIKHYGFSFHDKPEVLEDILSKHPDAEFVQLQINYLDWESDDVESRKCYEIARKYNIPVIIMEPVKGGTLANLTPKAEKVLKNANPSASPASWAIRYCASMEGIITVLSGMSNMEQLEDNVSYMSDFKPISAEEQKVIDEVTEVINSAPTIPCTACQYCVDGCPAKIDIPGVIKVMNEHKKYGQNPEIATNKWAYGEAVKEKGTAGECIGCAACEGVCPQHIAIIDELSNISKLYD